MFKITLSRQCPYLALVGKQQRLEPAEMNPANPPSTKSLLRHLDGRDDVCVLGLGWEAELLPEDIETPMRERSQPPLRSVDNPASRRPATRRSCRVFQRRSIRPFAWGLWVTRWAIANVASAWSSCLGT